MNETQRAKTTADPGEIADLYHGGAYETRVFLSENPNAPSDVLQKIAEEAFLRLESGSPERDFDTEEQLLVNVASHDHASSEALSLAARYHRSQERVVWHPNTPSELLHSIVVDYMHEDRDNWYTEHAIALQRRALPNTLVQLVNIVDGACPSRSDLAATGRIVYERDTGDVTPYRGPMHVLLAVLMHRDTPEVIREHAFRRLEDTTAAVGDAYRQNLLSTVKSTALDHRCLDDGTYQRASALLASGS